ncbi:hypothetical protein AGMMS49545_06090 [Betaproteobacteria bacterium]|nr:hypothetical protein AGMMS49545_06090 [Betaproteobacteria bacterium]
MSQELEQAVNLVLEHLQALNASGERIELELREFNAKLTSLEAMISAGRQDTRFNFEEIIRQQTSIDSLNDRVTLMQRKLKLPDPRARHSPSQP